MREHTVVAGCRGVEQWQLAGLITLRKEVRFLPPPPDVCNDLSNALGSATQTRTASGRRQIAAVAERAASRGVGTIREQVNHLVDEPTGLTLIQWPFQPYRQFFSYPRPTQLKPSAPLRRTRCVRRIARSALEFCRVRPRETKELDAPLPSNS